MARATLDAMALGGMHDLVGGGFHRYAVDRRLARAALREDALRQRPARDGLPRGLGRDRRAALPRRGRGDARLPAARDAASRGWVRVGAGRRHRRRRGLDLRLDSGRSGARARSEDAERAAAYYGVTAAGNFEGATVLASRASLRRTSPASGPGCSRRATPGRSRPATTRRSPPGTASRWRRSPRAPGGSAATTCSTQRGPARRSSLERMTRPDGRLLRSYRDGDARIPAFLDDYAAVATETARAGDGDRRRALVARAEAAGPARRSSASRTQRTAAFSTRRATPSSSSRSTRSSTTTRRRRGTRCWPMSLIRLGRIHGDRELESLAAGALRLAARHGCAARRTRSGSCSRRSTSTCRPRARWRSSGRATTRPPPRFATPPGAAFTRRPSTRSATARRRGRAAPRGQGARRRAPGRVHLRAVRLPRAAHRRRRGRRRDGRVTDLEALKAEAGAEAVDRFVRYGMRLGLGSGSTAAKMLEALGERIAVGRPRRHRRRAHLRCDGRARADELGIPLTLARGRRRARRRDRRRRRGRPGARPDQGAGRRAPAREGGRVGRPADGGRRRRDEARERGSASGRRCPVEVVAFALPVVRAAASRPGMGAGAARRRRRARSSPTRATRILDCTRAEWVRPGRAGARTSRTCRASSSTGSSSGSPRRRSSATRDGVQSAGARVAPSRRSMTATASGLSSIST